MSITFKPHNRRRKRRIGFRARMKTVSGRRIINARRRKGRKRLAAWLKRKKRFFIKVES